MSHHDVLSSNEPDTPPPKTPVRILIINPNTNVSMTESLKPVVDSLGYRDVCSLTQQAAFVDDRWILTLGPSG